VIGWLEDRLDPRHPFARVRATPDPGSAPDVWLLGSSDYSARLAAMLGLPFAFADFFGRTSAIGPSVVDVYRREFRPTVFGGEPRVNVTVQVICAPTAEEADRVAASRRFMRAARVMGIRGGLLPPEEAMAYPLSEEVRAAAEASGQSAIDGDPDQVKAGILAKAEAYGTTDIGVVSNCYAFEDRVRSYELVAEVFRLGRRGLAGLVPAEDVPEQRGGPARR